MALFDSVNQLNESRKRAGRRQFLFGAIGMTGSYFGYRWWRDRPRPVAQRPTRYVTPSKEFYTVSIMPGYTARVNRTDWRLEVFGTEGRSYSLSYDELVKLEQRRVFKTFMCVGNG